MIIPLSSEPVKTGKNFDQWKGCEVLVDFVNNNQTSPVAIEVLSKRWNYIIVGLLGIMKIKFLPLVPLRAFNIIEA